MAYTSHPLPLSSDWHTTVVLLADRTPSFALLDSCEQEDAQGKYDWLAGGGSMAEMIPKEEVFPSLRDSRKQHSGWWFGRLNYDVKNDIEALRSENARRFDWREVHFFEAEWVVTSQNGACVLWLHPQSDFSMESWMEWAHQPFNPQESNPVQLEFGTSKEEYLTSASKLLAHIQRGDIYEVNFCVEFYAVDAVISPLATYRQLRSKMSPPMSALLKEGNEWVLSMSPERYLQKQHTRLLSQPIKGTARRSQDVEEDAQIAADLFRNPKERAENIMIVDLVRNDLSRVAQRNSVKVTELCGIHSFKTVHQMISTVEAELSEDCDLWDAIRASFPMGSMTGAPKYRAMELIEEIETHRRGVYSGAIGYIDPEDNFDFNVVIRSVVYDSTTKDLSVSVGSALTISAQPETEWEECLLKLSALREVLANPVGKPTA
ncbi:MAG: anthranilate synthase component I family protein [Bacteroidetes bacterium]|nr:MAG: anthranilate synthase component I family protein [Bacteroidota bacterium]